LLCQSALSENEDYLQEISDLQIKQGGFNFALEARARISSTLSGLVSLVFYNTLKTRDQPSKSSKFSVQILFLANNLRFLTKLIDKAIVINGKIHKNKRKKFYSSNKEGLIG
jgi:hypothetical protein